MLYATDGKCHNAEPGTYGHECRKPAQWIGTMPSGFRSGFCVVCRAEGYEARRVIRWEPATPAQWINSAFVTGWHHGSLSGKPASRREAEERFPAWRIEQIDAYLNGYDDGIAGCTFRLKAAREAERI